MNVLKYLNSKDARSYFEKLDYQFSPLDSAKIIENCGHIDLNEKHEAFYKLIAETQDEIVTIPEEYICEEKETTLHTLLKNYINAENDVVHKFYNIEKDFVYVIDNEDSLCIEVYSDFHKALRKFINIDTEKKIVITKKSLSTGAETSICFDRNGYILWVRDLERCIIPYTILCFEYSFSESVPSPFVIGDLVIPSGKYKTYPIVITKFDEETISGYSLHNGRLTESQLYLTVADLEYYPEKDVPVLKVVSEYLKGKTNLCTLVNDYHRATCEEYAASL